MEGDGIRLQVFLARAGICSRRAAEEMIGQGRVTVNGLEVRERGTKVLPDDRVLLDGRPLETERRLLYLALNKPPGYICSSHDPQGRPRALDLLPAVPERLYGVGRLDFLSSGLIFFTNDGDFAAKLGHPSAGIEKEYFVEATGHVPDELIEAFLRGIELEGEFLKAKSVTRLQSRSVGIVLVEGKNREIRRVFSRFRLHPLHLRRIRIGPVRIGNLAQGESRPLEETERELLLGKGEIPQTELPAGKFPEGNAENRKESRKKPRKELTW